MKPGKKGQVEFIVIVALVVIAIVAVVLASRQAVITPPTTPGITEEAKTIKDSVVNLIKSGVNEQLIFLYNQGGTVSPSPSVEFGMFSTQVWSACGEKNIPDFSQEIGEGLWAYLRKNLDDEMEFYGKEVQFDFSTKKYDISIFKDSISIKIYLPTTVENLEIQQPYEVSVQSDLYDVLEFSENLIDDARNTNFFEMVTITSMLHSNPEHENWLPVAGVQTDDRLFKTRADLLPALKEILRYTVSHIVWNKPTIRLAENPFYPIYIVGGKFYPDIEAEFAYPGSWDSELDKYFAFAPDPINVIPKPLISLVPVKMAPYSIAYTFRYPLIVMVKDSSLNHWLKFAVMVDIENTQPGQCNAEFEETSEYDTICVAEADCPAKITVKDTQGSAVEGAGASFYVCDLGKTDDRGVIETDIPCMVSELHVFKEGYRSYADLLTSEDVTDINIVLKQAADSVKINLYGIRTEASGSQGDGDYDSYSVKESPKMLTDFGKNYVTFVTLSPTTPNYFTGEDIGLGPFLNYDDEENLVSYADAIGIQPIEYEITVTVARESDNLPVGFINKTFEIEEGVDELYVYFPVVTNVEDPGINYAEAQQLTILTETDCSISAVSTEEQTASC